MARRSRPSRRGAAARKAVSGVLAAVLGVTLSAVPAQASDTGVASGSSARALRWTATPQPFRLSFLDRHRPLVAQAAGDTAGPGGRMAYALADGTTHRLTDLVKTTRGRDSTTYLVGTDEPARTARVTMRRTPRGLR